MEQSIQKAKEIKADSDDLWCKMKGNIPREDLLSITEGEGRSSVPSATLPCVPWFRNVDYGSRWMLWRGSCSDS